MSARPDYPGARGEPVVPEEESPEHSPEPWTQHGRYIRDAEGEIVVRGKTAADARRIVAAVNATRDIPTEALESWLVQDVSDPRGRPNLELDLSEEPAPSPFAVAPPERREAERRQKERRGTFPLADAPPLIFDRRVMERRVAQRRRR